MFKLIMRGGGEGEGGGACSQRRKKIRLKDTDILKILWKRNCFSFFPQY